MGSYDQPSVARQRTDLSGLAVLIAEDEAIVAMGLVDLVEDAGGEVIGPFASVSACLSDISERTPDLAILDLRLEDGESHEVASRLADRGIPVVFHSGHMVDEEWKESSDTVFYCPKPCPHSEMRETLLIAAKKC